MEETWATIVAYPDYEVSDCGRVRRRAAFKKRPAGALLSSAGLRKGYPSVQLWRDGKGRSVCVHKLVAEAFLGVCPEGRQVNHRDGNKRDPRVSNLEYVTNSENVLHSYRMGLQERKGRRGTAGIKLTKETAAAIRNASLFGESAPSIAARHGVSKWTVYDILSGRRWGDQPRDRDGVALPEHVKRDGVPTEWIGAPVRLTVDAQREIMASIEAGD